MTKFQKYATLFIVICLMIVVTGLCCKVAKKNGYKAGWEAAVESAVPDTVWRTDTITYEKPVPVEKWIENVVYVPVTQTDTIHHHDTTYIALQFEKKLYQDSTYRAVVSGYQPSLDQISVFPQTAYITNTVVERAPRWSFGVSAGPGVFVDFTGAIHVGGGVVAGVQYRF